MIKDVRFRSEKYTKKIISENLYKKWLAEYPQYSKYSYKDFCNFWKLLAEKHVDVVVSTSSGVKLNNNLGQVALKYATSTHLNRNYKNSNLINEPVGHLNFASSGKNGKIVWSIGPVRKINIDLPLIGFQACRNFTIKAANAFKETPELFKVSKLTTTNIKNSINPDL
jgi:hypothetical protein